MTIRFLSTADGYAQGSVVTLPSAVQEATYVAAGTATYDTQKAPNTTIPLRSVLGQQGIPCIVMPTGTIATNGAITAGTALPLIYPRAWVYLPAGTVVGGLAGWYYAVFTSTTAGQVYTAFQATMGKPYIPPALTAGVGSNAAYTGVTGSDLVLGSVTVPANLLGQFGGVEVTALVSYNSTAGAKTAKVRFGGQTVVSSAATTSTGLTIRKHIQNRATNAQVIQASLETGVTVSVAPTLLAIDTTADVAADVTGQIATATDYIVLEHMAVEVLPSL